jgi:protein-S-isoprenylcysteine O-methyltransferase Ste14
MDQFHLTTSLVVSSLWILFGVVWIVSWLRTKPAQQKAPPVARLLYSTPILIGSYLIFADWSRFNWARAHILPRSVALDLGAIMLTTFGIGLAIWARFYLGTNWSSAVSVKVGHELVRTGPYRWVRHPIYCGLLLALVGTALQHDRLIGLAAVALFWLGFWIKSGMEEQFMRQTFGEQYAEYCKTTGGLMPKLPH